MINNNRIVENTWNMLQYLYDELRGKKFVNFDISNVDTIDNLYALVIARWCSNIAREGLYKEYVTIEGEELTSPRGQIDVQQSIVLQTRSRGTLVCNYDEFSSDVYLNHILKGALQYLLFDRNVAEWIKTELQKTMMMFNGVSYVDLAFVKWKTIKYDNGNIRYKHLVEVIRTLIMEQKLARQGQIDDNIRTFLLFKKQLFKWIKMNYKDDLVTVFEEPFTLDNEPLFEYKINRTQKLIVISTDKKALILCVRLQTELVLEDTTLGRKHMEELVKYIQDYCTDHKVNASGCIIYVNTDKTKLNFQPITTNVINDYTIGEQIVDLHDQWRFIANKINDCYKCFIQRSKNKEAGVVAGTDADESPEIELDPNNKSMMSKKKKRRREE